MAPDLNSLPPSRSPVNPGAFPPSPRSSSVSLAAAATINAGIQQQQDSRPSSISSRSQQRRLSNVALNLHDPSLPAPGELQSSDHRARGSSIGQPFRTSSPQNIGSPTNPLSHHRAPSLGELHQELEQEQEAQVNRLLEMIRQQQLQLQQMQQHANYTPTTSTAAADNSTPMSERSFSFPNVPATAPMSISNPRARSPARRGSYELSRRSSRQSRTPSRTGSPSFRPSSAGLQVQGEDWMLSAGGQGSRDDAAYFQAETQMLTRENQMLKMRIRDLERQLNEGGSMVANSPSNPSHLAGPPIEADT
ncbi:MAG: hypothetical protein L6R40_007074 [Gallowayella cf. fulva]|nr:MAG: hypothetical protein L6R40_007074 [Xanthomendoza cf. fulva]